MKRVVSITAVLLLTLAGLSAAQTSVYRFQPGKNYRYLAELKSNVIQEAMGQVYNVAVEGTGTVIVSLVKTLENGSQQCRLVIDNCLITVDSPQGVQTFGSELNGKEFLYTIDANGKVLEKDTSIAKLPAQEMQALTQLTRVFLPLRLDKLKVGESWEDEQNDTTKTPGGSITSDGTIKFKVIGTKTVGTRSCLEISLESDIETSGSLTMMGEEARLSGASNTKGTVLYDPAEGLLIQVGSEESGDQTITPVNMPSQKLMVTQSGSGKLELLKD